MTWWLNSSSIILVLGASTACITGIVYACCSSMRQSRCSKIKCCCFECQREIMSDELAKAELEHQEHSQPAPSAPTVERQIEL